MRNKRIISAAYVLVATLLLSTSVIIPQGRVAAATSDGGKRAGIYIAVSQTDYPYGWSTAQDFMNAYSQSGLFTTILLYAQAGTTDFARTLQLAQAADSIGNFKMVVDIGFDIGSSSDWSAVQSFVGSLATYPSVGWVGIEGEHTTYTGCEFGGSCPSIGEAWNSGTLSESQLESYYSQFDSMVTSAGLGIAHYYLNYGSLSWIDTQQAVYVTQWPACGFSGAIVSNCNDVPSQDSEILGGTTSNFIGISAGLSTNVADYWNPTVSGSSSTDAVISTYISAAESQPASSRQLVLFETGAYNYVPDWVRTMFTNDLQSTMSIYSDWLYPGSPPTSTTTSSTSTTSLTSTTGSSTATSSTATSTTSSTSTKTSSSLSSSSTTSTSSQTYGSSLYSLDFASYPNGEEPANWYYDPSFSVQNGIYESVGSTGYQVAYFQGQSFSDFTYSVTSTGLTANSIGGQLPPVLALAFRMQDRLDGYWFWGDIDKIQIVKWVGGYSTVLVSEGIGQINPTGTFSLSVTVSGNSLSANWNNQYEISVSDTTFSSGYVGVGTYHMDAGFNDLLVTGGGSTASSSSTSSTTSVTDSTSTGTSSSTSTYNSTSSATSTSSTSSTPTFHYTTSTPVATGTQPQDFTLSITGNCPATGAGAYPSGATATVTLSGVCGENGGSRLRVTSWSLDGGASNSVLSNGTLTLEVQMEGPHTLNINTVSQYLLTLDYGAQLSLLSITPPSIPGDYYWYDSGTFVTYVGSLSPPGYAVAGWELDGGAPNSIFGAADLVTTFQMSAPHSFTVLLAPATSSCSSNCASPMYDVTIRSNTNLPSGIWVDGKNYPSSVTFVWQGGSVHNVTAGAGIRQSMARTQFNRWTGISNSTRLTTILTVNESGTLTADYTKEYLVSLGFTDAVGQPLTPNDVTVSGTSDAEVLGANFTIWVVGGQTYSLSSVSWMGWNSVMPGDSTFTVSGPAHLTFPLNVYPQTIKATDAYNLPLDGATVNVTALDGATLFVVTNSSGLASFRVPVGLFSASVSYLGVSDQITSSTAGSHSYNVGFILSYPLIGTISTITAVVGIFALLRLRKRPGATIEFFSDAA